ncbi:MAG: M48 family metalloprotease [candidate division WOR-3 bacterium]
MLERLLLRYLRNWVIGRVLTIILVALLFSGCTTNPATGRLQFSIVGTETERKIGHDVFLYLDSEAIDSGPFIKDGPYVKYLEHVVSRMYPFFNRKDFTPIRVVLSPSAEPNAWALPGYLSVNIGLLQCLENESQLAFVIAHEMGHIDSRHTAEKYSQMILANLVVTSANIYAGQLGGLIGSLGSALVLSAYSRSQEYEADKLGFYYATQAGYSKDEIVKTMSVVESCGKDYMSYLGVKRDEFGGFLNRLFSDHPLTKERVKRLSYYSDGVKSVGYVYSKDFDSVKRWAKERNTVLREIDKALYIASSTKDPYKGLSVLSPLEATISSSNIEPEIKAKYYVVKAYLLFNEKMYREAQKSALIALDYVNHYLVAAKIAGLSGLRAKGNEDIVLSKGAFERCLSYKPNDPLCLKGALIASCTLKDKSCSSYCRQYLKVSPSDYPSVSSYCVSR